MFLNKEICLNILLILLRSSVVLSFCQDENNNPIDWFVIYKIPKLKEHVNPLIKSGVAYAFITPDTKKDWILSNKSINDTSSMPGMTLRSLYSSSDTTNSEVQLYILYNDQPPSGNVSFTGGHTKGVVVARQTGGFWLVHSVPHYPPLPSTKQYSYPVTGLKNGQSFLCVSTSADQIDTVGKLLMYNYPHIFAYVSPPELESQYPNLGKAAVGTDVGCPPWYHSYSLVSSGGTTFQAFAKAPQFNKDLYSDWVATVLQVNLLVETWPNGPGRLNSSCRQPYSVENVDSVNISVVEETFSSHKDHSKWAISETNSQPWVCIGDINRAVSQAERGGGTVCITDPLLWQAYNSTISDVEGCPIKPTAGGVEVIPRIVAV